MGRKRAKRCTLTRYERTTPCKRLLKLSAVQAYLKCDKAIGGCWTFNDCGRYCAFGPESFITLLLSNVIAEVCLKVQYFHDPNVVLDHAEIRYGIKTILFRVAKNKCSYRYFGSQKEWTVEKLIDQEMNYLYKYEHVRKDHWYRHFVEKIVKHKITEILKIVCRNNYAKDGELFYDKTIKVCDKLTALVNLMAKDVADWSKLGYVTKTNFFKHLRHPF